ncbi:meso-2,3-butanediol dehydrogenase-like [Styela clava]
MCSECVEYCITWYKNIEYSIPNVQMYFGLLHERICSRVQSIWCPCELHKSSTGVDKNRRDNWIVKGEHRKGASSGIGAATAIAFSKEGAKLTICGRNKERLSETAKECKENGAEVFEIVGDLLEFEHLEQIINKTVERFSAIDVLINNAGRGLAKTFENVEVSDFDMLFGILVRAPVFLCKYALPYLKKTKGCVVNVSSIASMGTKIGDIPYQMFKCALNHFTKGFSAECSPFGVRVNCINPALVETRIGESSGVPREVMDEIVEQYKKHHPFGIMQPETIADGIMFLCSSPHVTGIALPVDSGFLGTF